MEFVMNPDGSMSPKEDPQGNQPQAPTATHQPAPTPELVVEPNSSASLDSKPVGSSGSDLIKDSNTASFMIDVIEASAHVPVIVDFWAPWCGPCKQLGPLMEKLVRGAGGTVKMVKVNVDENQELASQMQVKSIPAVYAFKDGQPIDSFMGAVPESQFKTFIEKLTDGAKGFLDQLLDQADALLEANDPLEALTVYGQAQQESPENERAVAGMIRAAVATDESDTARDMIEGLPEAWKMKSLIAAAISTFELEQVANDAGDTLELQAKVDANPKDLQARLELALCLYAAKQNEQAIDELLETVRQNKDWNEGAARENLIKIFDALGPTHELTTTGRRKLSSILFS